MEVNFLVSFAVVFIFVFGLDFYCLACFPMGLRFFVKGIRSRAHCVFLFFINVFRRKNVYFDGAIKSPEGLVEIEICSARLGLEVNSMKINFPDNGIGNGGR